MCTAAAATMGLQAYGGVSEAANAKTTAAATNAYYTYLAKQNEVEADVTKSRAEQDVTAIQDKALIDEKMRAAEVRRLEGAQRTALAANGVWSNSRTAQDINFDTLSQSEKDAAALRFNADAKAYETRLAAADRIRALKAQAKGYRYAGANSLAAGDANAMSSLITTAGSVGSDWLRYKQTSKGKV